MTSKIKVDNINKVSDDSNIINKCSTNITVGANGDTVIIPNGVTEQVQSGGAIQVQSGGQITIASGATITNNGTQVGFGREGTVNWNTTPVTATPTTATSGTGYFMNTSGGAKTINLPGSPSAGDIVSIKDYEGTFATYNCTVARNGNNIRGGTIDFIFSINNSGGTFIYVDATEGWQIYLDGSDNDATETFVTATVSGSCNSIVTCGNYKLAVFQNPGTFTVSQISGDADNNEVDYLVVAGGGGSATGGNCGWGGGGGAGGYRESPGTATCYTASPLGASPATAVTVTAQSYPIDVGGGGAAGGSPGCKGTPGANSVALGITSTGGGGGSGYACTGLDGGSGGGGGGCGPNRFGGIGNTPPVNPAQGRSGGQGKVTGPESGGGGGGAIGVGVDGGSGPGTSAGCGGAGTNTGILGSSPLAPTIGVSGPAPGRYFGGGGGGGNGRADLGGNSTAPGGVGGGGTGGSPPSHSGSGPGTNGTATTGGGAGAMGSTTGGSGIVIIRYKFQ